jgi:hypothetical protein
VPGELTCPGCRHVLQVADDALTPTVTCPRCLHEIPASQVGEAVAEAAPVPDHASCFRCGKILEKSWRVCPHCAAGLRKPRQSSGEAPLDLEVRRDRGGTYIVLLTLAVALGTGVVAFFVTGGFGSAGIGGWVIGIFLLAGLAIVLIVTGMVLVMRSTASRDVKALSGSMGGCAAGMTAGLSVGLVMVILIVGAIFAAITSFLKTCSECGRPPQSSTQQTGPAKNK